MYSVHLYTYFVFQRLNTSIEVSVETNPTEKSVHGGQSAADRKMASEKLKAKSKVRMKAFYS